MDAFSKPIWMGVLAGLVTVAPVSYAPADSAWAARVFGDEGLSQVETLSSQDMGDGLALPVAHVQPTPAADSAAEPADSAPTPSSAGRPLPMLTETPTPLPTSAPHLDAPSGSGTDRRTHPAGS
jgi:hypothetical protein